MKPAPEIDPGHADVRGVLQIVGPAVALTGLVLIVIGTGSLFAAMGTFEPPRYFWCAFVGIPVLFVGGVLTQAAFLGRAARYVSAEVAPVQKDTFNYLAEGTAPGLRTAAQALAEGFAAGSEPPSTRACPRCGRQNDPAARFCDQCGGKLE